MRCIVHIGTEKTGTTSFQAFMHENRAAIREQGIVYPINLGGNNHRMIATYGLSLETADESVRNFGIITEEQMREFYGSVEQKLVAQLPENSNANTWIISSEHLHSRLTSVDQIKRVKNLLQPIFDDIEIHVHLRPQIDVLVSLASTQTRVGGAVRPSFFERAKPDKMYYNYDMLVEAWEDVFGAENVYCLAFRDTPDFLGYISQRVGLNLDVLPKPKRVNEAIDVRVMSMVNALVDSGSSQRIDHRVIDRLPVKQKLEIGEQYARKIQHRFEASNRRLIERRHDLLAGQLQPKWARYLEQGNLDILDARCCFGAALADLVSLYNEDLESVRSQPM